MQVNKWISIESVVPLILDVMDENIVDEGMILEYSYRAMKMLQIHSTLIPRVKFLEITNYKVCLPKDLEKIEMVILREGADTETCIKDLSEFVTSKGYKPGLYSSKIISEYLNRRNWKPMLPATNKFSQSYFCNIEYDLSTTCSEDYRILPGGILQSSLKEGIIAISYLSNPMHEGDFLIPDNEELQDAIKAYVLKTIWEARTLSKEEGAYNMFQHYSLDWALKKANVKGKFKMPTLEEMSQIEYERTKFLPRNQQIREFFQNTYEPSRSNLGGAYLPSY